MSTYTATDDEDGTTPMKWSLSGGDSEKFALCIDALADPCAPPNSNTAELAFKSSPDFEAPADGGRNNVYNVTVVVTDSDEMTDSRDVAITVSNVEEDGTVTLSNLQPEVDAELTAELTDPDGEITGLKWQWAYAADSIDSCATANANDCTDIVGATSATYTPVSGDVDTFLWATATYTDGEGEDKSTEGESDNDVQPFDDTNEPPEFPDQDLTTLVRETDQTRYVEENKSVGDPVVLNEDGLNAVEADDPVTATDGEGPTDSPRTDTLTYTLSGPDAGSFTIDEESGQIRVGADTKLDYESTKKTYTVRVTATDPSLASDTITVTIKVVDVDEMPVISKSGLSISGDRSINYAEDRTDAVATYTAAGSDSDGATWRLEGADAGDFSISSGGVLTFRTRPDFESPADQGGDNDYNVMVKATSTSGAIEASYPVTVTVGNLEEDGSVTLLSDQNQVKVDVPITAAVTDIDVVRPNTVTWQWASSANATGPWADIAGATSEAYTPVEDDVGNYLQATASYEDGHGPNKSESAATTSVVLAATTDVIGDNGVVTLLPAQPVVGEAVTASLTDLDVVTPNTVTWQWARASTASGTYTDIPGATSETYTPVQTDVGRYLQATASYTDAQGPDQSASAATANAVNAATTTPINRFDSNRDGSIQRSEVIGAIQAFLFGKTATRAEVIKVIHLHLFG